MYSHPENRTGDGDVVQRLLYRSGYANLVLSGQARSGAAAVPFFFVSGVHEPGFPWGDGETFSDVLLAVGDGAGGFARYCISDRTLAIELAIEQGSYAYRGPIFALLDGHRTSFSQMRAGAPNLQPREADIEIQFQANGYDPVLFPFPLVGELVRRVSAELEAEVRRWLPSLSPFGFNLRPYRVSVRTGHIRIRTGGAQALERELEIDAGASAGEAEQTTIYNLKEPTLLYDYLCAVDPAAHDTRVQVDLRTMRDHRERWARDRIEAIVGTVVNRAASVELHLGADKLSVMPLARRPSAAPSEALRLIRKEPPILEVDNDHFPTAVLRRSIVEVIGPAGKTLRALDEDMTVMRLEAVNSQERVKVASIRDDDKLRALDRVLDETAFDQLVRGQLERSGKPSDAFSIVIKPNFMFSYDVHDRSSYTDPELVGHLARRLRRQGYSKITVAEAQSTYGEYFDKRSVAEMAEYLGYRGSDDAGPLYEIVDLTLDASEPRYFGPHLGTHPLPLTWRDADLRIAFAKNKTHAYSYYTLTLKCVYGALPLADKFKEYHCKRDIYHTTIEYLAACPVHFGLVDAYESADGPFGVFADTLPNQTHTILGGSSLIAVDWVAATKMGIDPQISPHMKLAVERWGKPEIELSGDASLYRPWLNVPVGLSLFGHEALDAEYHFGNVIYAACAQMDETRFTAKKQGPLVELLRRMTLPLRRTFFVRTGENPSLANRVASRVLYRLGF